MHDIHCTTSLYLLSLTLFWRACELLCCSRSSDDDGGESDDKVSDEKKKKQKTIKEANALIE